MSGVRGKSYDRHVISLKTTPCSTVQLLRFFCRPWLIQAILHQEALDTRRLEALATHLLVILLPVVLYAQHTTYGMSYLLLLHLAICFRAILHLWVGIHLQVVIPRRGPRATQLQEETLDSVEQDTRHPAHQEDTRHLVSIARVLGRYNEDKS